MWRDLGTSGLELAGFAAVVAGIWQLSPEIGLICLGVCLVLFGWLLGR